MAIAIMQARMSSTRLPGKVIKPILATPMILLQIERLRRSVEIKDLIVATSTDKSDDTLVEILKSSGVEVFRGALKNVHERFSNLLNGLNSAENVVVRITADCPVIDPEIIDKAIAIFKRENFDYLSNSIVRTFPRGLDVEVFRKSLFLEASKKFNLSEYQKEHVTPVFYQNPDFYKLGHLISREKFSNLRWTVDTEEDFSFIRQIYENLYPINPKFGFHDVLKFLKSNPTISNFEDSSSEFLI
jgi:spore coat polysaccharide biosynthesis protein SpsF